MRLVFCPAGIRLGRSSLVRTVCTFRSASPTSSRNFRHQSMSAAVACSFFKFAVISTTRWKFAMLSSIACSSSPRPSFDASSLLFVCEAGSASATESLRLCPLRDGGPIPSASPGLSPQLVVLIAPCRIAGTTAWATRRWATCRVAHADTRNCIRRILSYRGTEQGLFILV